MTIAFVHLSDIHFGQEKGGARFTHDDAKERLIEDARAEVAKLSIGHASGILITGDIAYSGAEQEYKVAAVWIDRVAQAVGCAATDVQVVPGNHDVDQSQISDLGEYMLGEIRAKGEPQLDKFLADETARAALFRRFKHYGPFAEAHRCPLDLEGRHSEERAAELAPGRTIRFVRLNSALACTKRDEEGTLLLGAGQRTFNRRDGEELIVLSHHPLHWFQDHDDALRFLRSRARVFISGHEHNPSVKPEDIEPGCQLLRLAAGATVPPHSNDDYTYCYNLIEFDWDESEDALVVTIHPRAWNDEKKRFEADERRLGAADTRFVLGCPNFRAAPRPAGDAPAIELVPAGGATDTVYIPVSATSASSAIQAVMTDPYPMIVLRFFRDISAADRLAILVDLGALPAGWTDVLLEGHERLALDSLIKKGLGPEVRARVDAAIAKQEKGE